MCSQVPLPVPLPEEHRYLSSLFCFALLCCEMLIFKSHVVGQEAEWHTRKWSEQQRAWTSSWLSQEDFYPGSWECPRGIRLFPATPQNEAKQLQLLPQLTPFAPLSHVQGDLDETCLTISSLPLPKGFRCRCSRYCVQFKGSHHLVPLSSLLPYD